MGEYLDSNNRFLFKKVDYKCVQRQILGSRWAVLRFQPSWPRKARSLHCLLQDCYGTQLSNTSPQYFKNSLFVRKNTIKTNKQKKIMLTWWGLLNYTYYLFISRVQVAHLTDVLQGCLNTSAPCLLQCSDSHLLYKTNKNWITLWQSSSTGLQAGKQ